MAGMKTPIPPIFAPGALPAKPTKDEIKALLASLQKIEARRKITTLFPDKGPLARSKYRKHMQFFEAGATHMERAFMAANRVGKTIAGGVEMAFHATGEYPEWWKGRRFAEPIDAWAAGDTGETTRDIIQLSLLGTKGEFGTGLIPGTALVGDPTSRRGLPDAVDTIAVRHKPTGGISRIGLKSYDQGRRKFQGTAKHVIWSDEEPPVDVYTEMLIRLMTTDGIMMATFTPLLGLSEVALRYLPELAPEDEFGELEGREQTELERMEGVAKPICIQAGWDDAPHLSEGDKKKLYAAIPAYQREARTKGIPQLGSGAIYPFSEDDILCDPFEIPVHFRRCYALDVGWNRTAALWLAQDQDTDTVYAWAEHYRSQAEPAVHASAINRRGVWIPGVIDPAARGRSQKDGERLIDIYGGAGLGLKLTPADNAVEAGILDVYDRFSTGRLKIFKTLRNAIGELRTYRRDEKGKIVKERDHLMDCLRYGIRSGLDLGAYPPRDEWHKIRPGRSTHQHDYDAGPWGGGR